MDRPSVDIVIVNWNTGTALAECLAALDRSRTEAHRRGRLVIVDNGSTDESLGSLAPGSPDAVRIVDRAGCNLGFAAACNRGAAQCDADYLLFLNPDTRVDPNAIDAVVAFMERPENARVGVCGAQMRDASGAVQRTCAHRPDARRLLHRALGLDRIAPARFPGLVMHDWPHDTTRRVDHVIGAFYLVRRPVFAALGGFDERFFVYLEDLDFSVRAAEAGWEVAFVAGARVEHAGGGASSSAPVARRVYATQSRMEYARKHFGPAVAATHALATLLVEPFVRTAVALVRADVRDAAVTAAAWARLWAAVVTRRRAGAPRGAGETP